MVGKELPVPAEIKPEVPECGVCAATPPAFRYSLPEGYLILKTRDVATGQVTEMRSSGSYGLCAVCREVCKSSAMPAVVARRLSARLVELPQFSVLAPEEVKRARKNAEKIYQRLIPMLADEKPFVDDGKDPFDHQSAWQDLPPKPDPSRN